MEKVMTAEEYLNSIPNVHITYERIMSFDFAFLLAERYAAYRERIMAEKAFCAAYYDGMGNQTVENAFSDWWKEQQENNGGQNG